GVTAVLLQLADVAHAPRGVPRAAAPGERSGRGPIRDRAAVDLEAHALRLARARRAAGVVAGHGRILPDHLELAGRHLRQGPEHVGIPAGGLDRAQVGEAVVERADAADQRTLDAFAVQRIKRLHAQVELGLGVDGLDRAVDAVAVVGQLKVEPVRPRHAAGQRRAEHQPRGEAARGLRLEVIVATGGDRYLRDRKSTRL